MPAWECPDMWPGSTVFIIGGGASLFYEASGKDLTKQDGYQVVRNYLLPLLKNRRVIGVNNAYLLGDDLVDICWFGDCKWYLWHKDGLKDFSGIKATCCNRFASRNHKRQDIMYLEKDREHRFGISKNRWKVAWNKNSGSSAINLAVHLGAKRIVLLAFDMCIGQNGETHWHGGHVEERKATKQKQKMPGTKLNRFLQVMPQVAKEAEAMDIEIINASTNSVMGDFRKEPLMSVLERIQ